MSPLPQWRRGGSMLSHGNGPTGQPAESKKRPAEIPEIPQTPLCAAMRCEADRGRSETTTALPEIPEILAAMHAMPALGSWVHAAARLRGREGRGEAPLHATPDVHRRTPA